MESLSHPFIVGVVVLLCGLYSATSSSEILIETTPSTVTPLLTPKMTLSCILKHSTSTSGGLIGRSSDVTSTPENMDFVTSIVVLLKTTGQQVASLTEHTAARLLLTGVSNVHVSGNATGGAGVGGYIEIVWTYPTESQVGEYECEINGISKQGHSVVFKTSTQISAATPSISDLVQHIHTLEINDIAKGKNISAQQAVNDNQQQLISNQQHLITTQQKTISDMDAKYKSEIADLKSKNLAFANQIAAMQRKASHIETGDLTCSPVASSKTVTQTFQHPYDAVPVIVYSVVYLEAGSHNAETNYRVSLESPSTTGFAIQCEATYGANIHPMHVRWISFPK